ncbi:SART-1 family-domain-containing protein [Armillaria borealis]|uniref:SART-1 family-domain-containing protein n=1 Tax=Armillaria borealis TaxID=47425 RepID=A0AA39MU56_9AGAR|nr:SART-1 family-domain-containing protein [Armillaria borealis]
MSMEESISLEETNKIRISLGLKPLTDDKGSSDDKEKQAEDNYAKQREREAKDRESKKIQDKIAKVRNRRELNASLKGSTLGDADGDTDDTLKWIKRSKKKEKELAKKRQQELENLDKMYEGEEYTERDLAGLKVSHDLDAMEDGEDRILTLKDSRILDNEEDELQNVEMAEAEATKKRNDLKIKKRDYTGYDDEEFVDGKQGMKRSVLSKYDEELEGSQEMGFRLGSAVKSKKETQEEGKHAAVAAVNKALLSIDYDKNIETGDYLKEGDVGFKKPKAKKKRSSRRAPAETELADANEMDVDQKPIIPRLRDLDVNFVDDDELQAALARSRKTKLRKATKLSPEELAKKIAAQRSKEEDEDTVVDRTESRDDANPEAASTEGLTFDDTSEFVRSVGNNPIVVKKEPKEIIPAPASSSRQQHSVSRDVSMAPGDEALEELEAGEDDYDMDMLNAIEDVLKTTEAEGATADDGVGWHTFCSECGWEGSRKNAAQRDLWLADQRRRVAQREMERLQSRGGNRDQAQREYENRIREQQEARENLESFKNYKPDVNIVYYDEYGRSLTPKEAWKALSHKFHGKGSGKMKTEKRLKKIAEEQKKAAMVSGDTPLSMNKAFLQRQEKAGQAHFVLSVGNRGAVPQAADFIETQPLSKGKTEKAKKKKESNKNAQAQAADSGFITLPAPAVQNLVNGGASGSGFSSIGSTGSPAPKPGFSRIGSAAEPSSRDGTPGAFERSKVTFGFGTKRKADGEAQGSPPSKRR